MSRTINIQTLANGLTLIVEEMKEVESIAYDLIIPGGLIHDNPSRQGASLLLGDMLARGAGNYDAQALLQAFEDQGIVHGEGGGGERCVLKGACLASDIGRAIELTSLMVHEPHIPEDDLESVLSPFLLDIQTLPDNPARRVMIELSRQYMPEPFNRSPQGQVEGLRATTVQELKQLREARFKPEGSVISFAGKISLNEAKLLVEKYFGDWKGKALERPSFTGIKAEGRKHISFESAQLQIALAINSAPFKSPFFYTAKVVSQILSGGMFGRLFIEVREKRGLCYSVSARHSSDKDHGVVVAYAGTTPERAHETGEVMIAELQRVAGTVTSEELDRAKANLRAGLIISEESSSARAASNANDWIIGGRIRSDDEILTAIQKVDAHAIDEFIAAYPPHIFNLVTLGSKEITL